MSNTALSRTARLLARRWQVPLALLALGVSAAAVYRLVPAEKPLDVSGVLADITELEGKGQYVAAADAAANLLELQPPLPKEERASLHARIADLIYQTEMAQPSHRRRNVRQILEHQQQAIALGWPETTEATIRRAFAQLWLNQAHEAMQTFRGLLSEKLLASERRTVVQSLARLLEQQPEARSERLRLLRELLEEPSASAAYVWWALQRAVHDALVDGDAEAAQELLDQYGDRLTTSDLEGYLEYLRAMILLHEGKPEEAEPLLYWVDDWIQRRATHDRDLDENGHLPSLNQCLMGVMHLAEQRPQAALEAFDTALRMQTTPEVRVEAEIGRGQALATLLRHTPAREAFEAATESLDREPDLRQRAVKQVQQELLRLYDERQLQSDLPNALGYLALASALSAKLAPPPEDAESTATASTRPVYTDLLAWDNVVAAAGFLRLDEDRLANLLWTAAQAYDTLGRVDDLLRALHLFVRERSDDERMPRALLLLGQAYDGRGELDAALSWYRQVIDRYPELEEAARARVYTARALVSMGSEKYAQAEEFLADLLTGEYVTPSAPAYREALLVLCELLQYEGRYADAIGRLWDFCELYPDDPQRFRVRFMLANAHRRSAQELRTRPPTGASAEAAAAEGLDRLRQAAGLYDALLSDLEGTEAEGDFSSDLYAQLALMYRGDCLLELNEPDTLHEALRTYGLVAARYAGQPVVLTANVQIANIYLRQGDLVEAARALERARWLLQTIPDDVLVRSGAGDRAHWQRFLSVVLSSELFRDVFAAAQ